MGTERIAGPKALVIGGGIGGLCAAIALQTSGWDVAVLEKAQGPSLMGAGIVLAPNAMKVLDTLGAGAEVRERGAAVKKGEIRAWNGELLTDLPVHEHANRFGTYSYLIHRSELQSVLFGRLRKGIVHFDKTFFRWEQDVESGCPPGKVRAVLADGEVWEGDLLIGADGVRSSVREQLTGGRLPLRYAGFTALRGIAYFRDEHYSEALGGGFEALGPGRRFGFSQLGRGSVFWFAAINAPQGRIIPAGNRKQAALRHFEGWFPPIPQVIEATEEAAILSHDIFDRKPLSRWSDGHVTLLGDAAHPMLPNLGQGGAQAMEDAVVLARCLNMYPQDVPTALKAYEQRRKRRTAQVVRRSRLMGRMMQLEHPAWIGLRNRLLQVMPAHRQMDRLEWLIGHEV